MKAMKKSSNKNLYLKRASGWCKLVLRPYESALELMIRKGITTFRVIR